MQISTLVPIGADAKYQVSAVALACQLLSEGNIIAVPTDTVYGLAASAQDTEAVRKLYGVKGRNSAKPLAICVGEVEDVSKWGKTDILPQELLRSLLPGPVTVILERTALLNAELNPYCRKVGVRVPDHPFVRQIVQKIALPVALTSANLSNEASSLSPKEFEHLWPHLAAVFDGGLISSEQLCMSRAGSTVVDLSVEGKYHIVRSGSALSETLAVLRKFELKALNDSKSSALSR